MKSKSKKEKAEKAIEFAEILKSSVDLLKENGQDTEFVKTFDLTVRKLVKLQKELITLKDKVRTKKEMIQEIREQAIEQSRVAMKITKDLPEIKKEKTKKEKKQKVEKTEKPA